jgi:hypothetical protein
MALPLVVAVDALAPTFGTTGTSSLLSSPGQRLTRLVGRVWALPKGPSIADRMAVAGRHRWGQGLWTQPGDRHARLSRSSKSSTPRVSDASIPAVVNRDA